MGRVKGRAKLLRARARKEKAENAAVMRNIERLAAMSDEDARAYVAKVRRRETDYTVKRTGRVQ